eukprot:gene27256-33948_t
MFSVFGSCAGGCDGHVKRGVLQSHLQVYQDAVSSKKSKNENSFDPVSSIDAPSLKRHKNQHDEEIPGPIDFVAFKDERVSADPSLVTLQHMHSEEEEEAEELMDTIAENEHQGSIVFSEPEMNEDAEVQPLDLLAACAAQKDDATVKSASDSSSNSPRSVHEAEETQTAAAPANVIQAVILPAGDTEEYEVFKYL